MKKKHRKPEVSPTTIETSIRDLVGSILIGHLYHELRPLVQRIKAPLAVVLMKVNHTSGWQYYQAHTGWELQFIGYHQAK